MDFFSYGPDPFRVKALKFRPEHFTGQTFITSIRHQSTVQVKATEPGGGAFILISLAHLFKFSSDAIGKMMPLGICNGQKRWRGDPLIITVDFNI